jgi:hypothetical protein
LNVEGAWALGITGESMKISNAIFLLRIYNLFVLLDVAIGFSGKSPHLDHADFRHKVIYEVYLLIIFPFFCSV